MNLKPRTVLSFEQALTLPYATQRFVQLGWRVIRVEAAGKSGGDPNRYIGKETIAKDLHSYFIAPNVGKEAITLNLKTDEAKDIIKTIIKECNVDIFLCNTLPKRYKQFGIDYETLKEANDKLIWCGISALGPDYPDRAGYDPALQGLLGFMHLTGDEHGDPMLCGLPIIDLRAGEEAYSQVMMALLNKEENSEGSEIHISMAECATTWLITALPQLAFFDDKDELSKRCGNENRSFIPSNCYKTKDGYVYLAIGSNMQWEKLCLIEGFAHLKKVYRTTNNDRKKDKENIYADIRKGLENYTTNEFIEICIQNNLAVAPVHSVEDVAKLDYIKSKMVKTLLPNGKSAELIPAFTKTDFLDKNNNTLKYAPRLGEHNKSILKEAGFDDKQILEFKEKGII